MSAFVGCIASPCSALYCVAQCLITAKGRDLQCRFSSSILSRELSILPCCMKFHSKSSHCRVILPRASSTSLAHFSSRKTHSQLQYGLEPMYCRSAAGSAAWFKCEDMSGIPIVSVVSIGLFVGPSQTSTPSASLKIRDMIRT